MRTTALVYRAILDREKVDIASAIEVESFMAEVVKAIDDEPEVDED